MGATQKVVVDSGSSLLDYLQSERQADARRKELMEKEKKDREQIQQHPKPKEEDIAESTDVEDNLSLSEIIARKYTRKVHKIRSPEEAAKVLIKDTQEFDVNSLEYSEGTKEEQDTAQKKLGNIETNLASRWQDLGDVKQRLWEKIHNEVSPEIQSKINNSIDSAHQQAIVQANKLKNASLASETPLKTNIQN